MPGQIGGHLRLAAFRNWPGEAQTTRRTGAIRRAIRLVRARVRVLRAPKGQPGDLYLPGRLVVRQTT